MSARNIKYKKQFRLYDIYRFAVTKEMSNVQGITRYFVNKDASVIDIHYEIGPNSHYKCKNEQELKDIVRIINKRLCNCCTPGPKAYKSKQLRFKL